MSELKFSEVPVKRKPIWKSKVIWAIGIIIVLFLAYKLGSSPNVPEDIGENYYSNALWAFHELNVAFENGEFPSNEVTKSISDNAREVETNSTNYTDKEKYISEQFIKMILGVGEGLEEQVYEARSNLANLLEVDENY
ncbi:hypothetical protein JTI58_04025 [Lysinibacillus fusiformis]|uniref:hypothetical protein n=1 Tax=Lysinibacillus fusiformis TaxID=28031 RepID=UPI0019684ABA|nr:hypothetical protein [Lysinibacillus fusiformis]QSB10851.1 hypothetical protein JTI58_04025 [Lysinibacillus fusiformis]